MSNRLCPSLGLLATLVSGAAQAEEKTTGLPQFDPHSFASQIFWLVVMFVVVFVFMKRVGIPRVQAIIQDRKARIVGDLDEAERLRNQADETMKSYEAALAEAHGKARKLVADTHEKNVATLAERTKIAATEFDKRIADAVARVDAAQEAALRGVRDVAVALATDITSKVAGGVPKADAVTRAVDAVAGGAA